MSACLSFPEVKKTTEADEGAVHSRLAVRKINKRVRVDPLTQMRGVRLNQRQQLRTFISPSHAVSG